MWGAAHLLCAGAFSLCVCVCVHRIAVTVEVVIVFDQYVFTLHPTRPCAERLEARRRTCWMGGAPQTLRPVFLCLVLQVFCLVNLVDAL